MRSRTNSNRALALLFTGRPYRLEAMHYNGYVHKIFATEKELQQFISGLTRPEWLQSWKAVNPETYGENGQEWSRLPNTKD